MAEAEERFVDRVELTIECSRKVLTTGLGNKLVENVDAEVQIPACDTELQQEIDSIEKLVEDDASYTDRSEELIKDEDKKRIDFSITPIKNYQLNSQQNKVSSTGLKGLEDEQNNNPLLSSESDDTVIQIEEAISEQVPQISSDSHETVLNVKNNSIVEQYIKSADGNVLPECLEKRKMLENINNNNAFPESCISGINEVELGKSVAHTVEYETTVVDDINKDIYDNNDKKCVSTVDLQIEHDKIVQIENESHSDDFEQEMKINEASENVDQNVINLSEAKSEVVVDYQTVVVKNQLSVDDSEVNDDDYVVISATSLDSDGPNEREDKVQEDMICPSNEQLIQAAETSSKQFQGIPASVEQNQNNMTFDASGDTMIRSFGTQDYREQNKDLFELTAEEILQEESVIPTHIESVEMGRNTFVDPKTQSSQSKHSITHPTVESDFKTKEMNSSEVDASLQISEETIEQVISELNQRKLEADIIMPVDAPVQEAINSETSALTEASFSTEIEIKEVPPLDPIEVERKFTFTENTEEKVLQLGCKLFRQEKFLDIYYDNSNYSLTLKDIWLRQRNDSWEMKIPVSKSGLESFSTQYIELCNDNDIVEHLSTFFETSSKSLSDILKSEQIERFAKFTTVRKIYSHPDCTICLDIADFGFQVGEIEVMVSSKHRIPHALKTIESVANELGTRYPMSTPAITCHRHMTLAVNVSLNTKYIMNDTFGNRTGVCSVKYGKLNAYLSRFRPTMLQVLTEANIL